MRPLAGDQVAAYVLLDLALILVCARLTGSLFIRLGQPRVVGEIVAGIILGPTLLGPALWPDFIAPGWLGCDQALAAADPGTVASPTSCLFPSQSKAVLGVLGQIALLLFMFLIGLGVDTRLLDGKLRKVLLVGLGVVGAPVVAGFVIGPMLNNDLFKPGTASQLGFILFIAAILAVTAFPVMARILQEMELIQSPIGTMGIGAAAVCTVAMFMLSSLASSLSRGEPMTSIGLRALLSVVYLVVMPAVVRPLLARATAGYAQSNRLSSGLFALVIGVLLVSGLAAHLLGLTVIVGGFVAGLIMPLKSSMFIELDGQLGELTRTVLLPIFLAFSGLATDFTQLSTAALGGLLMLLIAAIVSKWVGGAIFGRLAGLGWQEGNVLGILMNCRGLLVLVVGLIGVQSGTITPVMQLGGVLIALVTTAMTGPLLDRFVRGVDAAPSVVEERTR